MRFTVQNFFLYVFSFVFISTLGPIHWSCSIQKPISPPPSAFSKKFKSTHSAASSRLILSHFQNEPKFIVFYSMKLNPFHYHVPNTNMMRMMVLSERRGTMCAIIILLIICHDSPKKKKLFAMILDRAFSDLVCLELNEKEEPTRQANHRLRCFFIYYVTAFSATIQYLRNDELLSRNLI